MYIRECISLTVKKNCIMDSKSLKLEKEKIKNTVYIMSEKLIYLKAHLI